jgi:UDP-glucose 4-epimerase
MGVRCLVTGGAGFIGSHIVNQLLLEGYRVDVVDNFSTGKLENLPEVVDGTFSLSEHDICQSSYWETCPRYDFVFHTAALPRVQPSIRAPLVHHTPNVDGTLQVLEYCRRTGAKLIFSGSSSVFSGNELPAHEEAHTHPRSPYSLQKLIGEQYIRLYAELYGLNYAILRYFSVYGERQPTSGAYTTVLGVFLGLHKEEKPLTITNDGEQRRDFTYVGDIARANIMAMNWRGTFNVGAGRNYSINEVAEMFGGEKMYIGDKPGEARETLADNSKARANGWEPTMDLEAWLKEQINA